MRKSFLLCAAFVLFASTIFISGCGEPKAELVPVSGVVLVDGEPTHGIMVMFKPQTTDENKIAPSSQAVTDASGKFELFTLQNEPGALVGPHKVSLIDTEETRAAQGEEDGPPPRVDAKFAAGRIQVDVQAGKDLTLEATKTIK